MSDIKTLKVLPQSVIGAKNTRLVTHEGYLVRELKVDLSTFPYGANRQDALDCGWLEISPYWNEKYELVYSNGTVKYERTEQYKFDLIDNNTGLSQSEQAEASLKARGYKKVGGHIWGGGTWGILEGKKAWTGYKGQSLEYWQKIE